MCFPICPPKWPTVPQTFQVTYRHNPTMLPQQQRDNIVNLIVLAYSAAPCDNILQLLGPDTTLCPGDTLVLDATRDGAGYSWQDGSTSPTYTVTAPGTYHVHWTHPECTWEPDTIVVGMVDLPALQFGPDLEFCEGRTAFGHRKYAGGRRCMERWEYPMAPTCRTAGSLQFHVHCGWVLRVGQHPGIGG